MKTTLLTANLSAALLIAPKNDIRYYLNGVHLSFHHGDDSNTVDIVSTNGHMLFKSTQTLDYDEGAQTADFSLTIPRDAVETVCRTARINKRKFVSLESLPDGRYMLGDVVFATVDGKFPDYGRVIPEKCSGEVAQFNHAYLKTASDALRIAYDNKSIHTHLSHNGTSSAVVHTSLRKAFVVVMPLRCDVSNWSA